MIEPLRVGTVPFSNSYPLDYFLPEFLPSGSEMVRLPPSALGAELATENLDIALLSTIELLRHPEYKRIPGMGVCSRGAVRSVLLFSTVEPSAIRTLALDQNSLTSVMLVRILLGEVFGIEPQTVPFLPPLENGLRAADAALTIGDNSFVPIPEGVQVLDLGELWTRHTGLPFVYAAWLTRSTLDTKPLVPLFEQAKEKGMSQRAELAEHCASQSDYPASFYLDYMTNAIRYPVGNEEEAGLALFLEKAKSLLV